MQSMNYIPNTLYSFTTHIYLLEMIYLASSNPDVYLEKISIEERVKFLAFIQFHVVAVPIY